jgi:hypothetical protein
MRQPAARLRVHPLTLYAEDLLKVEAETCAERVTNHEDKKEAYGCVGV